MLHPPQDYEVTITVDEPANPDKKYRTRVTAQSPRLALRKGIDWFMFHSTVDYERAYEVAVTEFPDDHPRNRRFEPDLLS